MASGVWICIFSCVLVASGLPEQGKWNLTMDQTNNLAIFVKSMYNNSEVSVRIYCDAEKEVTLYISWVLRMTECAEEYIGIDADKNTAELFFEHPESSPYAMSSTTFYQKSSSQKFVCNRHSTITLQDESDKEDTQVDVMVLNLTTPYMDMSSTIQPTSTTTIKAKVEEKKDQENESAKKKTARKRREAEKKTEGAPKGPLDKEVQRPVVAKTNRDGIYLFMLQIIDENNEAMLGENSEQDMYNLQLDVTMKGPYGYLSAIEWPLLPFYGAMCIVYVIYGIAWLIMTALNWRDLLRIQFWIGAVIVLGMLEKAVFFAEYESINTSGSSVQGAVIFAELVSCLKRTLARMLVVIVSLGFGIVKPRLGADQNKVVGCGFLYFLLSSIEGCLRVVRHKSDQRQALLASIPLAVLDAAICWWVFTSLVQTTRTLRLRRNVVKLSLYRHFTNTLVFAVLASVAFMIWSIKQHRLAQCISDWKEIWVDDAFWHLLFSIILLVIMILWRPTINNQRYAFSPLLDAADDEDDDDENPLNDAFEGMKMRPKNEEGGTKAESRRNKGDEDLKWIDENIPASVTDSALPSLLDSDEEIMTTKFEMSKME